MTKSELQSRFDYLTLCLRFSKDLGYFNLNQRTCLNMERGAIMEAQQIIETDNVIEMTPKYQIPIHLEQKCAQIKADKEREDQKNKY